MQVNGSVGQQQIVYRGYLDCVRSMARTEGLTAFYRGFTVSCIKTAPSAALQASTEPPAQTWTPCMAWNKCRDCCEGLHCRVHQRRARCSMLASLLGRLFDSLLKHFCGVCIALG